MCWQAVSLTQSIHIHFDYPHFSVFGSCQESINTVCGALAKSVFCGAAGASPVPPLPLVAGSSWRPWISNNCSNQEASKAASSRTWGNREKKSWFYIRAFTFFGGTPINWLPLWFYVLKTNNLPKWIKNDLRHPHFGIIWWIYMQCATLERTIYILRL